MKELEKRIADINKELKRDNINEQLYNIKSKISSMIDKVQGVAGNVVEGIKQDVARKKQEAEMQEIQENIYQRYLDTFDETKIGTTEVIKDRKDVKVVVHTDKGPISISYNASGINYMEGMILKQNKRGGEYWTFAHSMNNPMFGSAYRDENGKFVVEQNTTYLYTELYNRFQCEMVDIQENEGDLK